MNEVLGQLGEIDSIRQEGEEGKVGAASDIHICQIKFVAAFTNFTNF
jgi:hypothetical protein